VQDQFEILNIVISLRFPPSTTRVYEIELSIVEQSRLHFGEDGDRKRVINDIYNLDYSNMRIQRPGVSI
jgi:hypothetical protein